MTHLIRSAHLVAHQTACQTPHNCCSFVMHKFMAHLAQLRFRLVLGHRPEVMLHLNTDQQHLLLGLLIVFGHFRRHFGRLFLLLDDIHRRWCLPSRWQYWFERGQRLGQSR